MRTVVTLFLGALIACAREEAHPPAKTAAPARAPAVEVDSAEYQRAVIEANSPEMVPKHGVDVAPARIRPIEGDARLAFAAYLNAIHARLHPKFADEVLGALSAKPASDPLNDPKLAVRIELAIDGATGELRKAVVVRGSHVPAFDELARAAVAAAGPFGAAPASVRSPDGMVYVHWTMHRDEALACQTGLARPYILGP